MRLIFGTLVILMLSAAFAMSVSAESSASLVESRKYADEADEVTRYIQENFYIPRTGLYRDKLNRNGVSLMWGNGVMFTALAGASRYQPDVYLPVMSRFFDAMNAFWDSKVKIPGYEPAPTNGNGNDKYFDDNEWMVITFIEAYEMTGEQKYLSRARETLRFVLSGWDDQLGGGILWHDSPKDQSKNTCSNGPGAVACLNMAKFLPDLDRKSAIIMASRIVDWTDQHFQTDDGLYEDSENLTSLKKNRGKLTYNTALMIRADLGLYRWTQKPAYLQKAKRSAKAGEWFLDHQTGAYRDSIKWSHLMVEADLDLYRETGEKYLLQRATTNADVAYQNWKINPPKELIDNASIARLLWLMADVDSPAGRRFWNQADAVLAQ